MQDKTEPKLQTQQDAEEGIGERPQNLRPLDLIIHGYDMPEAKDSLAEFTTKKNSVLGKIVPLSLVPISTSNAMLLLASKLRFSTEHEGADCYFPLPEYMALAGTLSLSLVVMGVISRHIVNWVMEFHRRAYFRHAGLIRCLEVTGKVLSLLQALVLFSGIFVLGPQLSKVETRKPKAGEERSPYYCDYQLVMFATIYVFMSWVFIVLAMFTFAYVKYSQFRDNTREGEEVTETHDTQGHSVATSENVFSEKDDDAYEYDGRQASSIKPSLSAAARRPPGAPGAPGRGQGQGQGAARDRDGGRKRVVRARGPKKATLKRPHHGRSLRKIENFDRLPAHVRNKMIRWNSPEPAGKATGRAWNIQGPKFVQQPGKCA